MELYRIIQLLTRRYQTERSKCSNNSTVTLTGLNEYTNYSITVFASNVYGNGKSSDPIIAITDESSKLLISLCI